jgi:GntR family transcriptional regulator
MTEDVLQPLKTNRVSLVTQAQRYLGGLIHEGAYHPGDRLPSQAQLAAQLGISRATLREALLNLEQEGLIVRRHGVGTFVAPGYGSRVEGGLERLESILELAARQGLEVSIAGLDVRQEQADQDMAERLGLQPNAPVTIVERVIKVGKSPAAFMVDAAPVSILAVDDVEPAFEGSVLDLLRRKQPQWAAHAISDITALNADASVAAKLGTERGQAVLLLEEVLFDQQGAAVEFSRNYFVPECFRFHILRR